MYFTNSEVIKTETDVVLGGVKAPNTNISYLDVLYLSKIRIERYIRDEVKMHMQTGIDHSSAMELVMDKVYGRLKMFEKRVVYSEEELAEIIVEYSREYDSWKMSLWESFRNIHLGKIKRDTPVAVSNEEDVFSQEDIQQVLDNSGLDYLLERLSMVFDLGTSKVS